MLIINLFFFIFLIFSWCCIVNLTECNTTWRVNKAGTMIPIELCRVEGTRAILFFSNGILNSITGSESDPRVIGSLAKLIGKPRDYIEKTKFEMLRI